MANDHLPKSARAQKYYHDLKKSFGVKKPWYLQGAQHSDAKIGHALTYKGGKDVTGHKPGKGSALSRMRKLYLASRAAPNEPNTNTGEQKRSIASSFHRERKRTATVANKAKAARGIGHVK